MPKMFGGATAQEVHQKLVFGGRACGKCGAPATIRCLSFAPFKEMSERAPEVIMALAAANEGCVPMVEFTYGKFVRIGDAYACPHCRHDLEVTASRRPSWVLVEFKEGPGADRPLVQVPGFAVTP